MRKSILVLSGTGLMIMVGLAGCTSSPIEPVTTPPVQPKSIKRIPPKLLPGEHLKIKQEGSTRKERLEQTHPYQPGVEIIR